MAQDTQANGQHYDLSQRIAFLEGKSERMKEIERRIYDGIHHSLELPNEPYFCPFQKQSAKYHAQVRGNLPTS